MTLYELTNQITLQGNIEVIVFDEKGNEKETRFIPDVDDLDVYCYDIDDLEELEVKYMYAKKEFGIYKMVIEITEEE